MQLMLKKVLKTSQWPDQTTPWRMKLAYYKGFQFSIFLATSPKEHGEFTTGAFITRIGLGGYYTIITITSPKECLSKKCLLICLRGACSFLRRPPPEGFRVLGFKDSVAEFISTKKCTLSFQLYKGSFYPKKFKV